MGSTGDDTVAEARENERSWYLSGPAPAEQRDALESRFTRARDAYYARMNAPTAVQSSQ
jgi:hypothetical protein